MEGYPRVDSLCLLPNVRRESARLPLYWRWESTPHAADLGAPASPPAPDRGADFRLGWFLCRRLLPAPDGPPSARPRRRRGPLRIGGEPRARWSVTSCNRDPWSSGRRASSATMSFARPIRASRRAARQRRTTRSRRRVCGLGWVTTSVKYCPSWRSEPPSRKCMK